MQFQLCVIDDGKGFATGNEMAAIDAFNQQLIDAKQWVLAGGLAGPDQSILIDNTGSELSIARDSLMPPTPYYAGFWILELDDLETAEDLAVAASKVCNRRIELRRFLSLEDVQ